MDTKPRTGSIPRATNTDLRVMRKIDKANRQNTFVELALFGVGNGGHNIFSIYNEPFSKYNCVQILKDKLTNQLKVF